MSKFISKQSVSIWYALSALFATYIVGQVILWCFPDRSSLGASLLFILMNCVPLIMAAVFSLVLSEVKSLGEFFKKVFLQKGLSSKRKSPVLDSSSLHSSHLLWNLILSQECQLYWEHPLGLLTIFSLDLFIWGAGRSRLALVFTRTSLLQ